MKICIDYGHCLTGADTGAGGCGYREEVLTREIGALVVSKLKKLGHEVWEIRVDSATSSRVSLNTRVNAINTINPEISLSIHLNAFNGEAHGVEIFTKGGTTLSEASKILNGFVELGFRNRGIKNTGNGLALVDSVWCNKAMLVECGFIDNASDMARYNAEVYADIIVKGLVGETVINTSQPTTPPSTTVKADDWILRLQKELNSQGFKDKNGKKLVEDGIAGQLTLSACPIVKQGAKGEITKLLQEKLTALGYSTKGVDGVFGANTKSAVKSYQTAKKLSSDGVVGNKSWTALLGL